MKTNPEELVHGSKEWLQFRSNKITATDAPVIMKVSPWTTPKQLFEIKIGVRHVEETEAMRWGKDLEPLALRALIEMTGIEFLSNKVKIHSSNSWMMATLDGIDATGKNIAEIKCPRGIKDHEFAKTYKKAPDKYYPQLQHQMEVTGVEKTIYFSFFIDAKDFNPEPDIVCFEVYRDDDFIKKMIAKETEFWDNLQNFIAPEDENDVLFRNDGFWKDNEEHYVYAKKQREYWEEMEESYKKTLIASTCGKTCKGSLVKLTQIYRKGSIDYSLVPELKNVDLEPYRKEANKSWRITNI